MRWVKNTNGKEDALLTFALVSFVVVSFCVFMSLFKSIAFKKFELELTPPDNSLLLGYLAATFGSYITRRYHTGKNEIEHRKINNEFKQQENDVSITEEKEKEGK